jgi:hypothetical protein
MLNLDLTSQSANNVALDPLECSSRDQGEEPPQVWNVTSYFNPIAIGVMYLHLTMLEEFFVIVPAW